MEAVTLAQIQSNDPQPMRQGARTRYLCPLTAMCLEKQRDNAHRSLCVDDITGVYFCHRCGEKGKLREFWEERQPLKLIKKTHLRPVAALVSRAVHRAETKAPDKKVDVEALRERMEVFNNNFADSPAQKYLQGRGIPPEVSLKANCGYAPAWEHWGRKNDAWTLTGKDERVVFPVYDDEQNLVAIHSRAIGAHHINSSKITKGNKSRGMFYSSAAVFFSPVIAICEGPVDALALETAGIPAVAMIGTSAPKWLAAKLKNKAVLLATDADKAGDEAAMKLKMLIAPHTKNIFRFRPRRAKDWGEELEASGEKDLQEHLLPFAAHTGDVDRVNAAWNFFEHGFYEAAEFISRLVQDRELKESFLTLIHKEHLKAA